MKIAVIGSRDFNDYVFLSESLKFLSSADTIISGGARGADSLAERYAKENQINFVVFPADWDKFGKSAGYRRNVDIITECDSVIAFWDGKSRGTKHSIDIAKKQNKHVLIHLI